MTRRREALRLGSHWHVDCRLEAELPDDSIVSPHFIANTLCGAITVVVILLAGSLAYKNFSVRQQVQNWDREISENNTVVREIQRMQREYVAEASKIDQAYGTIRPVLQISDFLSVLAQKLPAEVTIEMIEWNDSGIVVRGYLREPIQKASRLLGDFVDVLRKDESLVLHFQEIRLIGIERAKRTEDLQSFGLKFTLKPLPPL